MSPPILHYTAEQSDRAHEEWQATCGHHAIAAACGISLDAVRAAFPKLCGYTSPTMLMTTLHALQRGFSVQRPGTILARHSPASGPAMFRIQWEGTWLNPEVPKAAAYKHTHWVAICDGWVLDPMLHTTVWYPLAVWPRIVDHAIKDMHRVTGWHFTHAYILSK